MNNTFYVLKSVRFSYFQSSSPYETDNVEEATRYSYVDKALAAMQKANANKLTGGGWAVVLVTETITRREDPLP